MDAIKQVIVIRRKFPDDKGGFFGIRLGKTIAQACHASNGAAFLNKGFTTVDNMGDKTFKLADEDVKADSYLIVPINKEEKDWYFEKFTKVCVQVQSEGELLEISQKAQEAKLPCFLVQDSGLTEFKGIPTYTCCAIGPALSSEIDKITGHLELL